MIGSEVAKSGILWQGYNKTISLLKETSRPVLLFVQDEDPANWPFLREIFRAMPKNQKLRELLAGPSVAMLLKPSEIPEGLSMVGAGTSYHIAILSPVGFTPIATFHHTTGDPEALVESIAADLNRITATWSV